MQPAPPANPLPQTTQTAFVSFGGTKKPILITATTKTSDLLCLAETKFGQPTNTFVSASLHDGHSQEAELDGDDLVSPFLASPGTWIVVQSVSKSVAPVTKSGKTATEPSDAKGKAAGNTKPSMEEDEAFIALNKDAMKYGNLDVMLSINCATMETSALWLKQELEARGVSVWVCTTELKGGANWRDDIFHAVKGCRVLIPFINEKWANSGECDYEFALAIRTNLVSHDSGKTQRAIVVNGKNGSYAVPGIRRPAFLPLKFPDIPWTAKPAVEQLSCSTNFIVCDSTTLLDLKFQGLVLQRILHGLYNLGIRINPLADDSPLVPVTKRTMQPITDPVSLAQQVITGIQYQLSNAQDLFTLVSRQGVAYDNMLCEFELEHLYGNYLGYSTNDRKGCSAIWSLEFKIVKELGVDWKEGDAVPLEVPISGTMTAHLMSIMKNKDGDAETDAEYSRLSQYEDQEDIKAVAKLKGVFYRRRGLVLLDAFELDTPVGMIRECKYRIVLQHDADSGSSVDGGKETRRSQSGSMALGLFSPKGVSGPDEWTSVIRLVAQ
ncbi:hypothetical protein BCR33DRAFT_711607 [Rhizoclosmatium globosum]|uniref:TIR domain-containing protein n=1 Tax=Rhizoclosmatium globosum TaxID=329046 RepID=A0A1Y2D1X6_9FUNG|nr:hypothetical protein BCR33DRAFT_711607 [Rhizoclosmatium globosum]|eukprot:ORY53291.1 hypothetical protein BCR33DRAFT_711607 [Rhizoclosmatium globosum]